MVTRTLVAFALCASACTHDQPVAAPANHSPSPEVVAASNDPLGFLPVDADIVGGFSYPQLAQSPLFKEYLTAMAGKPELTDALTGKCGQPTNVAMAAKDLGSDTGYGVLVVHGLERGKLFGPCMTAMKQNSTKANNKIVVDGDVLLFTDKRFSAAGTFATDSTFVMVVGPHAGRAALQAAIASGTPLRKSPTFTEMFGKVDTARAVWGVASGKLEILKQLSGLGVSARGLFGTVAVADGIALDGHLRLASADEASSLAALIKSQSGQAANFVDKLDIGNDGADVTFTVAMSNEKLKTIIGLVVQQSTGP